MPPRFHLEYFDPPPNLARHVLALFYFVWDEEDIHDRHPGALSQLSLFMRGIGRAQFDGGTQEVSDDSVLLGAFSKAVPYRVEGPWHVVGASLSALGWAALTGKPLNQYLDRFHPAQEMLGEGVAEFASGAKADYLSGKLSGKQLCDALAEWIAPRLSSLPPAHEELIGATIDWLGSSLRPDIDTLFARLPYSRRQSERLVERYFGFPPAALARKFRAVRASSLLAQEDLSDVAEAEIAEAFHDQPHMIREIRRYCGYTPTRLGGTNEPLFHTMLRLKNMDQLTGFRQLG